MPQEHIVKKQITINATPAEVWNALTNPEMTKQYFFKSAVHSTWRAGDPIRFSRKFLWFNLDLNGTILQAEPEKLLQYKLINTKIFGKPDPSKYSLVTDELSYEDGKTTLSISDDVGSYEGVEKRYERSVQGWDTILNGLKNLLESK